MNRLLVYFVIALFIVSVGWLLSRSLIPDSPAVSTTPKVAGTESWVSYTSPSQLWSSAFPSEPKYSTEIFRDDLGLPEVSLEGADVEGGGEIYFVRLYHYHELPPDEIKTFLDGALTAWKKKFPTLVLSGVEKGEFKGKESLVFSLLDKNLDLEGTVIKNGFDYYIVGWVGPASPNQRNNPNFQKFLNSFNLITE
jgi:hypothetical protein